MGKSVIIHHEQFSSRYTNSAFICQLFEITKNGHKDLSSKIFGNLGGENLVLSDNKVYFLSLMSSSASSIRYNALINSYNHLWYSSEAKVDLNNVFLKSIYEGFIDSSSLERNTDWKKNSRAKDKNDFTFLDFKFKEYARLASEILFCVSKPSSMSEEDFEEYLIPYGGREFFDPRVFLYDSALLNEVKTNSLSRGIYSDTINRHAEALEHMLTSRSYFLTSPVYIENVHIPGMLFSAESALKTASVSVELAAPLEKGTPRGTDLYRKVRTVVCSKLKNILDPEELIRRNLRKGKSSYLYKGDLGRVIIHCLELGRMSKPTTYKLTKCPNQSFSLNKTTIATTPYSSWLPKNSFKLQEDIIEEDIKSLFGIEKALCDSAIRTANMLRITYNSTTYLSRDLLKVIDLVLTPEVRWKGSRADKEKELCQYIFLLKCILKTPYFFKELLNKDFYSDNYKFNTNALCGRLITLLTGKDSIFSTDIFSMPTGWEGILSMQTDEHNAFSKLVRVYINHPNKDVYLNLAEECVQVLEEMVESKQVISSIEHNIQVCPNGSLFKGTTSARNYTLQKSCLDYSYVFPFSPNAIVSYSFLEDVHFILSIGSKQNLQEIDGYVSRVLAVISQILEIKASVALKTEESYYLNGPLLKFLDASLWISLKN